jgi:HEPN domain-containing protein
MNRDDFKHIAQIRFKEANTLFHNDNYDGACYLAGYVIECALKAYIAKKTKKYDFRDKRTVVHLDVLCDGKTLKVGRHI